MVPINNCQFPKISKLGFNQDFIKVGESGARDRLESFVSEIDNYHVNRDLPAIFGTISVRTLVNFALSRFSNGAGFWLSELIWREFFSQILYNFPHVVNQLFKQNLSQLKYRNNMDWFKL